MLEQVGCHVGRASCGQVVRAAAWPVDAQAASPSAAASGEVPRSSDLGEGDSQTLTQLLFSVHVPCTV